MPEADMIDREDIIRMAREALKEDDGEDYYAYTHQIPHWWGKEDEIVKFAELVAAAEREACARTAMELLFVYIGSYPINEQFADAIRARGQHD
jgi:hypothetical protein